MSVTSFDGKVAAVTGAGSGIGQQLAIQLSHAGCEVALADVNEKGLEDTRHSLNTTVKHSVHRVDVANRQEVFDFADRVNDEHGAVHIVFNNAGVVVTGSGEQMPIEDIEWLMGINFWGVVYGCKAFLPHLRKVEQAAIVNTSSIFGTIAVPSQTAYNASKFAVRGYTYALRQELADTHIGVSCVQPGGVKTNIVSTSRYIPDGNDAPTREELAVRFEQVARKTPAEAAAIVLRGVLKNKPQILVGKDARLIAWLERLAPTGYMRLLNTFLTDD